MTLSHDHIRSALREAEKVATATRRPVAIVADDRRGFFGRRPRGWRIELNPTTDHRVIVAGIAPRLPSAEMIEAKAAALAEVPHAMEALRILMNRCIKTPGGAPRTQEDVEAMLIDLAAAITAQEQAPGAAPYAALRRDLPGYLEPRA